MEENFTTSVRLEYDVVVASFSLDREITRREYARAHARRVLLLLLLLAPRVLIKNPLNSATFPACPLVVPQL